MRGFRPLFRIFSVLALFASPGPLQAGSGISTAIPTVHGTRTVALCAVAQGNRQQAIQHSLQAFRQAALGWNVEITLLPYSNSQQAIEDFRNGVCDLVNLTGAEAQPFNRFSATLEAPGALPGSQHLSTVLQALALEKAAPLMRNGEFEVVAIWPAGNLYAWVADAALRTPDNLAGHTLSPHAAPEPMATLASLTGMKLINGSRELVADLLVSDSLSEPSSGYVGALSLPLNQLTHQILARHNALPENFGRQARQHTADHFDEWQALIDEAVRSHAHNHWINLDAQQRSEWQTLYQQIRLRLRSDGFYDATALTLMRKVRCALDNALLECGGGALQVE